MKTKLTVLSVLAALALPRSDCSRGPVGFTPLNDLGPDQYLGEQGGLYPGGSNERPTPYRTAGVKLANCVGPLDDSPTEFPVVTGGFSIGKLISNQLIPAIEADAVLNPGMKWVNGCVNGRAAPQLADPNNPYWLVELPAILQMNQVAREQVQVFVVFTGKKVQNEPWPDHAETMRFYVHAIGENAKAFFPNLLIMPLVSLTAQHYANAQPPSEPYYAEQAFGFKWAIEDQINGDASNYDPVKGPVTSPYITWGFYPWCDADQPRLDGLDWVCPDDVTVDGEHPSPTGAQKLSARMIAKWKTDPVFKPWFLK